MLGLDRCSSSDCLLKFTESMAFFLKEDFYKDDCFPLASDFGFS